MGFALIALRAKILVYCFAILDKLAFEFLAPLAKIARQARNLNANLSLNIKVNAYQLRPQYYIYARHTEHRYPSD